MFKVTSEAKSIKQRIILVSVDEPFENAKIKEYSNNESANERQIRVGKDSRRRYEKVVAEKVVKVDTEVTVTKIERKKTVEIE